MTQLLLFVLLLGLIFSWSHFSVRLGELAAEVLQLKRHLRRLEGTVQEWETSLSAAVSRSSPAAISPDVTTVGPAPPPLTAESKSVPSHGTVFPSPPETGAALEAPSAREGGVHAVGPVPTPEIDPAEGSAAVSIPNSESAVEESPSVADPATVPGPQEAERSTDWESALGIKWLPRIGVSVLVLGLSFMLVYAFSAFDAYGKSAIAYLVALGLFAGGKRLEKQHEYRIYAWSLLGGAWAAGYFTTYSLYFVAAIHLVESEWVGLLLMGAYSAGMIVYSFRFRSQWVTALAAAIGYATIGLSQIDAFSLPAILLLSIFLVVTGIRLRWAYVPMLGLIGTYGLHILWEDQLVQKAPGWTVTLLALYWVIFLSPTLFSSLETRQDERVCLMVTGFNGLGLAAALSLHFGAGTALFLHLLAAGSLYGVLAFAATRWLQRRALSLLLAALAAALIFIAIPLEFSGNLLLLLWLLESELLLLLGAWIDERTFRILAAVGLVTASIQSLVPSTEASATAVVAGALYLNWYLIDQRSRRLSKLGEVPFITLMSYGGALLSLVALLRWFPGPELALAWLLLATVLLSAGLSMAATHLRIQSYLLVIPVLSAIFWAHHTGPQFHFDLAATLFVVLAYLLAWFGRELLPAGSHAEVTILRGYGYPATLLAALLLEAHVSPLWLPLSWLAAAAVLLGTGTRLRLLSIRLQSYLLLSSAAACFMVRLLLAPGRNATLPPAATEVWIAAVLLIGGLYAMSGYLRRSRSAHRLMEFETYSVEAISYLAMTASGVFTFRHVPSLWVAVVWMAGAVASLLIASVSRQPHYGRKAYLLLAGSSLRLAWGNLFFAVGSPARTTTVLAWVALAWAGYGIVMRARTQGRSLADGPGIQLDHLAGLWSAITSSFVLALFTFQEAPFNLLTLYWALEGLGLFVLGLLLGGRALRLSGVTLLGLGVLKVFLIDLAEMGTLNRIFSFIGLGVALIAVSYLYVRFSATIKRYM